MIKSIVAWFMPVVLLIAIGQAARGEQVYHRNGYKLGKLLTTSAGRQLISFDSLIEEQSKKIALMRSGQRAGENQSGSSRDQQVRERQLQYQPLQYLAGPAASQAYVGPQLSNYPALSHHSQPHVRLGSDYDSRPILVESAPQQYYQELASRPLSSWSNYKSPVDPTKSDISSYAGNTQPSSSQQVSAPQTDIDASLEKHLPKLAEVRELELPEVKVFATKSLRKDKNPYKTVVVFKAAKSNLEALDYERLFQPEFYVQEEATHVYPKGGPKHPHLYSTPSTGEQKTTSPPPVEVKVEVEKKIPAPSDKLDKLVGLTNAHKEHKQQVLDKLEGTLETKKELKKAAIKEGEKLIVGERGSDNNEQVEDQQVASEGASSVERKELLTQAEADKIASESGDLVGLVGEPDHGQSSADEFADDEAISPPPPEEVKPDLEQQTRNSNADELQQLVRKTSRDESAGSQ